MLLSAVVNATAPASQSWLLLIHQLPPRPLYLRAQVRRRLTQVGAIAVKNSIYVLPDHPECLEDLEWIAQEASTAGGEAWVTRAQFVHGLSDNELRVQFRDASNARFGPIKTILETAISGSKLRRAAVSPVRINLAKLRRQIDDAIRIDFFHADAGREVQTLMKSLERAYSPATRAAKTAAADLVGSTWVTRRDPHIDRLASAWLIRRSIDPAARFRFVDPTKPSLRKGERSFDMVGADFGHEGDRCTFETFVARLGLTEAALTPISQIVHDLDLKDRKFGRTEAAGIQSIVDGLGEAYPDSAARVTAALPVFDALARSFGTEKRK